LERGEIVSEVNSTVEELAQRVIYTVPYGEPNGCDYNFEFPSEKDRIPLVSQNI
jgi:hypothetical protein